MAPLSLRCALPGLLSLSVVISAGCAQFQLEWGGPGAPGSRTAPPPLATTGAPDRYELPELPPAPPFSPSDRVRIAELQPWVEQIAAKHELDPDLLNGVIWVESRFQPRAHSPAGARGLMQLMPGTAAEMAKELGRPVARVYDPELNIEMGTRYLLHMLDRFDGDETLALAAYNAGAGNVSKWMAEDGELPPRSLQYVENVQRARLRFVAMRDAREPEPMHEPTRERTLLAAAPPRPAPAPEVPPPPAIAHARPAKEPTPVQRPSLTPEPPLAETPYPPLSDEPTRGGSPQDEPRERPRPARAGRADALPSVLD